MPFKRDHIYRWSLHQHGYIQQQKKGLCALLRKFIHFTWLFLWEKSVLANRSTAWSVVKRPGVYMYTCIHVAGAVLLIPLWLTETVILCENKPAAQAAGADPSVTQPIGKIYSFTKMVVYFKSVMTLWCPSGFRKFYFIIGWAFFNRLGVVAL